MMTNLTACRNRCVLRVPLDMVVLLHWNVYVSRARSGLLTVAFCEPRGSAFAAETSPIELGLQLVMVNGVPGLTP